MTEKLSGFFEDTPQHRVEDARQDEINKLYDERQELIAQGVAEDDKRILALNRRLEEWTTPGATTGARAVENLINSSKDMEIPSSTDNTDQTLRKVDSPEAEQKKPDANEQVSEAAKYIKEKQKKIVDLRRELVINIVPKIEGEIKKVTIDKIHQWEMDYNDFQQEIDTYKYKDDLAKVRKKFGMFFDNWYFELSLIFQEAIKNLDKQ